MLDSRDGRTKGFLRIRASRGHEEHPEPAASAAALPGEALLWKRGVCFGRRRLGDPISIATEPGMVVWPRRTALPGELSSSVSNPRRLACWEALISNLTLLDLHQYWARAY